MSQPQENVVHCRGCSRLITLATDAQEGDVITCPFCDTKNRLRVMTVYVADPVIEA